MLSEERKIKTKAQLREYIEADCKRYPLRGRRYLAYLLQISEGAILRKHAVMLRKTEYYTNTGKKLRAFLYRARLMRFQNKTGIHMPVNICGKGMTIFHPIQMCINGNVTIGENCRIMPFVCLVNSDEDDLCPTIGDNVTLGIGCKVIGNVYIADGITVGAGAVVTKSFYEPGINIAGVPARKIGGGAKEEA